MHCIFLLGSSISQLSDVDLESLTGELTRNRRHKALLPSLYGKRASTVARLVRKRSKQRAKSLLPPDLTPVTQWKQVRC